MVACFAAADEDISGTALAMLYLTVTHLKNLTCPATEK
jgi:hypothetical protein